MAAMMFVYALTGDEGLLGEIVELLSTMEAIEVDGA